jgi:hypothetical protein
MKRYDLISTIDIIEFGGGGCTEANPVKKTVRDVTLEQVHWARFRGPCDAIFAAIYDEL